MTMLFRLCFDQGKHNAREKNQLIVFLSKGKKNGDAGDRTPCLSHAKRALYHLSYIPIADDIPMLIIHYLLTSHDHSINLHMHMEKETQNSRRRMPFTWADELCMSSQTLFSTSRKSNGTRLKDLVLMWSYCDLFKVINFIKFIIILMDISIMNNY